MKTKKSTKEIESQTLALALIRKMVAYEQNIDRKSDKSKAEMRHVAFLRALRNAGSWNVN